MPLEIHTSQFWNGTDQILFENAVQDYIHTLHAFNMVVGKPRPTAVHPLIEKAVKRIQTQGQPDKYVADFVVIDDTPPPPSLEEKKNKLLSDLRFAENAAMEKILPARKIRLAHIKYNDALSLDETVRTAEHQKDIELITTVQGFRNQYALIAAQAEAVIEDLTEQTVDSWQLPEFKS